jgi:hypothetical protein
MKPSLQLVRWRPRTDGWLCRNGRRIRLPFKVAVARDRFDKHFGYGCIVLAIDHQ